VVEDDRSIRKELALKMKDEGYDVLEASSIESTLEKMDNFQIDLLITDIRLLKGEEGIELVRLTKKQSPETPVVVMTTSDSNAVKIRALGAGFAEAHLVGEINDYNPEKSSIHGLSLRIDHLSTQKTRVGCVPGIYW